ncbi:tape measure protein [Pseudomonas sp. TMP25]|uniref:tape measure protein n=1 Tax=Pseudomonas sp. TMP25 TaxID=3136561 RepID=UPI0031015ED6
MTDIELRLTADVAQATKGVGAFSKQYRELVNSIEKPLKQVGAFRTLEASLEGLEQQSRVARDRVRDLGNELANASNPSKALTATYKDAVAELQRLTRAEGLAQSQLAKRRRELQSAKIDTSNLTAEQKRLSAELASASLGGRRDAATSGIRAQSAALGQLAREQRLANLEQAKADFGISRARQFEGALAQLSSQYQLLRRNGNLTTRELSIAQRAYTQRVIETKTAMGQLAAEQRRLNGGGAMLPGLVSGVGAAFATVAAIKGIANQADAYNLMNARLKLATSSQEEFTTAQQELGRIAQATQSPVASLVTLYGRISRPLKEAGRSQADILKVTEAVATSFRVSGATAEEAQNGVIQFAQALGSGALRGDEFNSVAEQAPRLMQALADSIGVPVGALREMASQGELTADVVTGALVSQLDVLRKEAETLPETVGGAMTALTDQWNKAIGQADIQPLIDAINDLAKTVSDPQIVESLVAIAGGMATLAGWTVQVASEFAKFADKAAFTAAQLSTGAGATAEQVRELEKLKRALVEVNAAQTGSSFIGSSTLALLMKFFAPKDLDAWAAELESKIKAFEERLFGLSQGEGVPDSKANDFAQELRDADLDGYTKYIGELGTLKDQQVKDVAVFAKSLVAAEKKANGELEKVKQDRLDIEKRYSTALAELGGTGDASYSNAQSLKVGARNALQAGDVAGAQAQAQAALKMLQDLAAAGENTYGFGGFIKELEAIELAANDIEQTNAENKIKAIGEQIKSLETAAAKLKDLPLSIKSDDASIEAVRSTIQALAAELGNTEIVIPMRFALPARGEMDADGYAFLPNNPAPPGFANGGKLRGPGTGTSDSILMWGSNGEFMQPKATVDYYGEGLMEALRQRRIPKFATGGPISNRSLPAIPSMNPALTAGPSEASRGVVNLTLPGGETYTMQAEADQFDRILKRLATKFGRK